MSEPIFIISPKTVYRAELMPRLQAMLVGIEGVSVLGQAATNVKVRIRPGCKLQDHLSEEVVAHRFIEPARKFVLAH